MKPALKRKHAALEENQLLAKMDPSKRVKTTHEIDDDFAIKFKGKLVTKAMLEQQKKELQEKLHKITGDKEANLETLKENMNKYLEIPNSKFRLKWFDPKMINVKKEGQRVGIFGMTGSGKSVVAQQIMLANRYIPYTVVQCSSDPVNHQYSKLMENDLTVYDTFDEEALTRVKQRQEKFCKEHEVPETDPPQYDADPSITVLLDDLSQFQKEINKSQILNYYFNISRHHKVLYIDLKQYYAQMNAGWRRQLSWVIIMKPNSPKDIKAMWSEFFGMFTLKEYTHIINTATVNHGCLVFNALSDSPNLEDRLFFYRAPYPCAKFKMGTQWSRKLQKFYYQHGEIVGDSLKAQEEEILQNMDKERALLEMADELKEKEKLLNNLEKEKAVNEKRASKRMRDIEIEGAPLPAEPLKRKTLRSTRAQKHESPLACSPILGTRVRKTIEKKKAPRDSLLLASRRG